MTRGGGTTALSTGVVYFGGGTPTAVDPALLAGVLDAVRERYRVLGVRRLGPATLGGE